MIDPCNHILHNQETETKTAVLLPHRLRKKFGLDSGLLLILEMALKIGFIFKEIGFLAFSSSK